MNDKNHNLVNSISELNQRLPFSFLIKLLKIKIYNGDKVFSIYKEETKPSLKIYFDTNSYYCFSAKKGGGVVQFYRQYQKISLEIAITELQDIMAKYDTEIQNISYKQQVKIEGLGKLKVGEHLLFKKYYYRGIMKKNLSNDDAKIYAVRRIKQNRLNCLKEVYPIIRLYCNECGFSKEGYRYLTVERKLTIKTIERFQILEIQNPFILSNLLKKEFSKEVLIQSGVFNNKGNFIFGYHRILIPYLKYGHVRYLRAREFPIGKSMIGKYIGTAGFTVKRVFNEDVFLFIKPYDELYLCEGEFDTMIAIQEGYNAIGFPGVNGIPIDKLKELKVDQYDLFNAFDADEAGDKAAQEICDKLNVKMTRFRPISGKDLSEVYNEN